LYFKLHLNSEQCYTLWIVGIFVHMHSKSLKIYRMHREEYNKVMDMGMEKEQNGTIPLKYQVVLCSILGTIYNDI
jgi:hypothetical protein